MAGTTSSQLRSKVRRRARRLAGQGVRAARRASGGGQRFRLTVPADDLTASAARLTPWVSRRPLSITAPAPAAVRALAVALDPAATTRDLAVTIPLPPGWPRPPAAGRVALPAIERFTATLTAGRLEVTLRLRTETSLAHALWAVGSLVSPATFPHAQGSRDVHITESGHPELAAFGVGHRIQVGPYPESEAALVEAEAAITLPAGLPDRPVIDISVANPVGRSLARNAAPAVGTLSIAGGTLSLADAAGLTVGALSADRLLDESTVVASRGLAGVVVTAEGEARAAAQRLAEFAATGLVIAAPDLASDIADLLAPELAEQLRLPLIETSGDAARDAFAWRARSSRQRRAALRGHAAPLVLGRHHDHDVTPEVSVLLVTNRLAMVEGALAAITAQTYPHLEVVLGLHGFTGDDLPDDVRRSVSALADRCIVVPLDADQNLGQCLAACTRAASGTLLVKMDDDDNYGVEHVWDLVLARLYTGADLVGKAPEITELRSSGQLLQRPFPSEESWGDYVIGATMLVARGPLMEVGGWRPTPWAVDKALLDRFRSAGRTVYRTHNLGWAYVRHSSGHTWERDDAHFLAQARASWTGADADSLLAVVVEQA